MNTLQYLMLGITAFAIVGSPVMLVKAVKRKQKHRLVEVPSSVLMLIYVTVDSIWPNAISFAPKFMHYCVFALGAAWLFEFFGGFQWAAQSAESITY